MWEPAPAGEEFAAWNPLPPWPWASRSVLRTTRDRSLASVSSLSDWGCPENRAGYVELRWAGIGATTNEQPQKQFRSPDLERPLDVASRAGNSRAWIRTTSDLAPRGRFHPATSCRHLDYEHEHEHERPAKPKAREGARLRREKQRDAAFHLVPRDQSPFSPQPSV